MADFPLLDAPLIKQVGLQPDSEVYGAFCKAIERGEQVRRSFRFFVFRSMFSLHHTISA